MKNQTGNIFRKKKLLTFFLIILPNKVELLFRCWSPCLTKTAQNPNEENFLGP